MLKQKAVNFDLTRENTNLKSQLESLRNQIKCAQLDIKNEDSSKQTETLYQDYDQGRIKRNDEIAEKHLDFNSSLSIQEIRDTKDDNYRLKAEVMRLLPSCITYMLVL